ncbi:MAG: ABC transporter permease, partial [Polyangiaceae bacterium]
VMSTAPQLLQAVIEEKQQRIAEVLLGAASPLQIMTGKLLGTTAVGLTVLAIYVGGGAVLVAKLGYGEVLSVTVVGLMALDVVLALVMFGSLFLAIGATANDIKDAQGLLTPVMVVLMLPLMTLGQVMQAPDGALSTGLSLFPLTAPLAMPLRLGAGAATPTWHVALAVVLVAATTVVIVWAAGRVFRIGMLAQGQAPGLRELWGWIVRG